MAAPLKVGLAGLGTVGASVVRLIDAAARRADAALRPADRGRGGQRALARQGPRHRHEEAALGRRPGGACGRSGDRCVRRTDRRRRQSGACGGQRRAQGRQIGGHRQQGAAGAARRRAGGARREAQGRAQFRGRGRRRHPDREDAARGARRQCRGAHLRHPQRHLQLHAHAHGARAAVVRRMPEGGAAAGLRRGRSVVRHRGPRHRAEAFDPGEPRPSASASIRPRSMSRASPRSPPPISKPPRSSAIASSCSASR